MTVIRREPFLNISIMHEFKVQERVAYAQAEFGSFPLINSDSLILFQTFVN